MASFYNSSVPPTRQTNANVGMSSSSSREEIVDRIQGVLSSLRHERDDLHRKKELAAERLRLAQEEHEALKKSCATVKQQLDELMPQVNDSTELTLLQQEVKQLSLDVQFQHSELLAKKSKVETKLHDLQDQDKQRMEAIRTMQECIRNRRERLTLWEQQLQQQQKEKQEKAALILGPEYLTLDLEHQVLSTNHSVTKNNSTSNLFWNQNMPRWINQCISSIQEEVRDLEFGIEMSHRILEGYRQRRTKKMLPAISKKST